MKAGLSVVAVVIFRSDGFAVRATRRAKMPAAPLRSRGTVLPQSVHWHLKTVLPPRFSDTRKHLLQPAREGQAVNKPPARDGHRSPERANTPRHPAARTLAGVVLGRVQHAHGGEEAQGVGRARAELGVAPREHRPRGHGVQVAGQAVVADALGHLGGRELRQDDHLGAAPQQRVQELVVAALDDVRARGRDVQRGAVGEAAGAAYGTYESKK